MATCSRKLASSIKVLCGIAVLFSLVQLVITAISFTKPCPIGLYFTSYTQYGNGFWVGGPIFLLSAFITYVAQHSYFSTRRVACVKAAAYLCVACIIGGVVVVGLAIRSLDVLQSYRKVIRFNCGVSQVPMSQIYGPFIATSSMLVIFYAFYLVLCLCIIRIDGLELESIKTSIHIGQAYSYMFLCLYYKRSNPYLRTRIALEQVIHEKRTAKRAYRMPMQPPKYSILVMLKHKRMAFNIFQLYFITTLVSFCT
ncbi:hypothetical protein TrispH2_009454 [Trichoplax sp. H2]|nr:hypothetical protein TrispH2_009454 [Trichoplax sp. H2]|eukprot:RDD38853.1 hypothetical protein TrispH2_009454 [Trichoplax sp. H2]